MTTEENPLKKVKFTIINRLGEFELEPFEADEKDIMKMIDWLKGSDMDNFVGKISDGVIEHSIIFPSAILKESVIKVREIKENNEPTN